MQNIGIAGAFGFLGIVGAILKLTCYIAIIMVSFKVIQALNVYINKNSK